MKKFLRKLKNKKIFIFLSIFAFLLFPLFSNAAWWNPLSWIAAAFQVTADILIALVLFIPLLVSNLFLALGVVFFQVMVNLVISPQYSYSGLDNPIISVGFPIVQNLGNIIIILGILVIGLATILGIEEYRAQRKLPALIICALLLNFSNVLCGFVIDISNILTNHFLKDTTNFGLLYDLWRSVFEKFKDFGSFKEALFKVATFAPQAITMIIYCFLAGLILIILAFVFIVRAVAIPVLVVLSPAAIASYVMPEIRGLPEVFWGHRKFFDWWLGQFLQWCFIGVTVAFFSYLAAHFMTTLQNYPLSYIENQNFQVFSVKTQNSQIKIGQGEGLIWEEYKEEEKQQPSSQVPSKEDVTWFQNVAPYFAALFLLYFALQVGFQTSAFGAAAVIAFAQRAATALRGEVGKRVVAGTRRLRTALGERIAKSTRLQKIGEGLKARYQKIPAPVRAGLEYGLGRPIYALRKGVEIMTGFEYAGVVEESKKRYSEAKEKFKKEGADAKKLAQTILNPFMTLEEKVAAWMYAKETGQFQKVLGALKEQNADANKLLISHIQGIAPINPDVAKSLIKVNPHLADEIKKGLSEKTAKAIGLELSATQQQQGITLPIKILMELTPEEFVSVNPDAKQDVFDYLTGPHASVRHFRAFLEKGNLQLVNEFITMIQTQFPGGFNWYQTANPRIYNYCKYSPGFVDLTGIKI